MLLDDENCVRLPWYIPVLGRYFIGVPVNVFLSDSFSELITCVPLLELTEKVSRLMCTLFFNAYAGLTELVSLNVSNSLITNEGLQHLKNLKNLRTLSLESCKVTASEIKKLQSTELPNLVSFRPEL